MGVAGCGKTVVAQALARAFQAAFVEGDDLHPPENVALMREGIPLDDAHREAWLDRVGQSLSEAVAATGCAFATCSALKRRYRDRLRRACPQAVFLFLDVDRETAAERVSARKGHFMPASLVESQFAILEKPAADERAVTVDAGLSLEATIAASRQDLAPILAGTP